MPAAKTAKKSATRKTTSASKGEELPEVVDNATKKSKKNIIIKCNFVRERVVTESSPQAVELYNSSAYGTELNDGKLQLSLVESLYLMEKKKIAVFDGRNKQLDFDTFVRRASRVEPNFWIKYAVYKDMRNRGYIVKTALKFGADFRVYDRGIKPGQDHARWIVYPVHEGEKYTWFDFAAKNRVAHSTKKRLMMGVVDDENDVTYWEIKWVRP
ncbi:MAG: tRNA-intron lyase [Nanoarchaeota archaeon]|nr:tRNA-intron lyase [Nanoarchaeota archaeon]